MTAPALVLDASERLTENEPHEKPAIPVRPLRAPVIDLPEQQQPDSERAAEIERRERLVALVTSRLWSSIFRRRAERRDRAVVARDVAG